MSDKALAGTASDQSTLRNVIAAVGPSRVGPKRAVEDILFSLLFSGLVYPQIWEDPDTDMKALNLGPGSRVITIASGGCNALSYLTGNPAEIIAVDLNAAHVALGRLKLAALQHLPSHDAFYRFVGEASADENVDSYERFVASHLDDTSRAYWDGRDLLGRRRIARFARNLYRHGLFGRFIGLSHGVCRLYGVNPKDLLATRSIDEQRIFFETRLAPLFDRRLIRWLTSSSPTLFGLGIPPAQHEVLGASLPGGISEVLKERLGRLAAGFPLSENYFTWQAFGRHYAGIDGPLPPYLQRQNYTTLCERARRLSFTQVSITERLAAEAGGGLNAYILLDAQDWMSDDQLNALWFQITRTARTGARVIFRTAGEASPLPGRVNPSLLKRWSYLEALGRELGKEDRSATYGGFHIYEMQG